MSYIRKSLTNVLAAVIAVMALAAIALWQFYLFVSFNISKGLVDLHGGTHHLWWAISAALIACIAGFFVFSVFLRYDKDHEIQINS